MTSWDLIIVYSLVYIPVKECSFNFFKPVSVKSVKNVITKVKKGMREVLYHGIASMNYMNLVLVIKS